MRVSLNCKLKSVSRTWGANGPAGAPLEADLRHLIHGAFLAVVEAMEVGRAEAERAREEHCREGFDARVVARHRGVERAARGGEHVLDVGKLALQLLEVGVRLEVGIGL